MYLVNEWGGIFRNWGKYIKWCWDIFSQVITWKWLKHHEICENILKCHDSNLEQPRQCYHPYGQINMFRISETIQVPFHRRLIKHMGASDSSDTAGTIKMSQIGNLRLNPHPHPLWVNYVSFLQNPTNPLQQM